MKSSGYWVNNEIESIDSIFKKWDDMGFFGCYERW
jgi:hypothetical protein